MNSLVGFLRKIKSIASPSKSDTENNDSKASEETKNGFIHTEQENDEISELREDPIFVPADDCSLSITTHLPLEMIYHVFTFLDARDLTSSSNVCRFWKKLCDDNFLWYQLCKEKNWNIFWIPKEDWTVNPLKHDWKDVYRWYHLVDKKTFSENEERNGCGTFKSPTVGTYKGEWKNSKKEGKGIHEWSDRSRYEGEWKNDKRNGFGIYYWNDGRRFEGQHINDKRNRGIFYWTEGSIYNGEYLDSNRHGFGVFTWPNGDRYEGQWRKGGRYGSGKLYCFQKGEEGVYLQMWAEKNFDFSSRGPKDFKLMLETDTLRKKRTISTVDQENSMNNNSSNNNNSTQDSADSHAEVEGDVKRRKV